MGKKRVEIIDVTKIERDRHKKTPKKNTRLEKKLARLEHLNARLIPYALLILAVIIILELIIKNESPALQRYLDIVDYVVLAIFLIDLAFIARKCRSTMYFFKNYWLDILAVFPFVLSFKIINEAYRLAIATRAGRFIQIGGRGARFASKEAAIAKKKTKKSKKKKGRK